MEFMRCICGFNSKESTQSRWTRKEMTSQAGGGAVVDSRGSREAVRPQNEDEDVEKLSDEEGEEVRSNKVESRPPGEN